MSSRRLKKKKVSGKSNWFLFFEIYNKKIDNCFSKFSFCIITLAFIIPWTFPCRAFGGKLLSGSESYPNIFFSDMFMAEHNTLQGREGSESLCRSLVLALF